ncbi:MAG TPA: pilus assembly protein PilM [Candidatus Polarisedimenticolaceae bacterium]|nr:pilus assembly protein PilM [Candidatus Polarisedimenticolaceae bacterium]
MNSLSQIIERVRGLQLDALLGLRPPYPPVALEVDRGQVTLVRLKLRRRAKPLLEAHAVRSLPEEAIPASIFQPAGGTIEGIATPFRELFERSGTRPGRVSLILPDNLAKVSLIHLPERPASARQLDELVRARMRRAVPFRLEEAVISYQVIPGAGRQIAVLVLLARKALIERYEHALESIGARVGLVDVSTPNLINLCHKRLGETSRGGKDAALLNCAANYFSLVIVRDERVIFFRCKTFAPGTTSSHDANGFLAREVSGSLSYYREKLAGRKIETLLVRSVQAPFEEVSAKLDELELATIEPISPADEVDLPPGTRFETSVGVRLAPAIGAAVSRGR